VLDVLSIHAAGAIAEQIKMESRPFTQDESLLSETIATLFRRMSDYRRMEIIEKTSRNEAGFLAHDEYDPELRLIAHVLGYINIAYKRFGDMIPMRIEEKLQSALADAMQKPLLDKFISRDGAEDRCRVYLEDSLEKIEKRRELTRKKDVLRMADLEIRKFQGSVSLNHD
jgi:Dynamin GTPase effector domain